MRKAIYFLVGGLALASCNRDADMLGSANSAESFNTKHYSKSELDGQFTPMSQSFGFSGKADALVQQLNYTYRGWAEPVRIDLRQSGIPGTESLSDAQAYVELSASAAWTQNDLVFVVWHAHQNVPKNANVFNLNNDGNGNFGPLMAGAITAYKQVGIGQYEFTDRVDFFDADYHEVYGDINEGNGNYEILMAGQRAQATSGYVLNNHTGAVVTRIDYDYINDEFFEGSIRELPLPGGSATDIIGAAKRFYVSTYGVNSNNNGTGAAFGGVYEVDRTLRNVLKAGSSQYSPGVHGLVFDPRTRTADFSEVFTMAQTTIERFNTQWNSGAQSTNWNGSLSPVLNGGTGFSSIDRVDMTIATADDNPYTPNISNDALVRSKKRFFISAAGPSTPFAAIDEANGVLYYGPSNELLQLGKVTSSEYDSGLDVLYLTMDNGIGQTAVRVLALEKFADNATIIEEFDVIGEFVDPNLGNRLTSWGQFWPVSLHDTKEITVFGSRNIAIAAGDNGVFFIQRDKLN